MWAKMSDTVAAEQGFRASMGEKMGKLVELLGFITHLSRSTKQWMVLTNDVALVPVAFLAALSLQLNRAPLGAELQQHWPLLLMLLAICALIEIGMNIHRVQLKAYESRAIALSATHAVLLALSAGLIDRAVGGTLPGATFVSFAMVYLLLAVSSRAVMLKLVLSAYRHRPKLRVLVYGAGRTGQQLVAALRTDETVRPVAYIDDNKMLQGAIVQGLHVHSPAAIARLARTKHVDRVLLAMPSVPRARLAQLSRQLEEKGLDVQTLPSFAQLAGNGVPLVEQLRPVVPGQFLGRAPLDAELPGGSETYRGTSVMISGAGGSIGSELCRQILACRPRRLVLFEMSELALYKLDQELSALATEQQVEIVPILGSVCDAPLVRRVLADQEIEIVLHAAAYKHVPLVESNPVSGFANNVLGTHTLAQAAGEAGVARFILISTDKAVRPKNMMGASKRMAELVVQDLASRSTGTIYSMVRFGNVLGSSGSVIPLFHDQICKGGPVTLTHREVTRYFMTIPEAARLVLVAGTFATGGDVFVLDMGAPVQIYDLARQMIEAAGYTVRDETNPDGDIEIRLTGLRAGEKLHEELLIGEGQIGTPHPKIMLAREAHLSEIEVAAGMRALRAAVTENDSDALRAVVARWVEGGKALALAAAEARGQLPAS
ncbi:FlaA1/EpsC-like NDP-sugar epimerase [Limimaricola soesokkakensis]|uniref:FlaA1/EpsC-like NDP-sugar epimerase n=2 Tax=Limimaricola soesokkakensis TaxID=1343159 RepID=A0A1X6ZRJ9_9RHOB|nr:FlaA1/EpsC-like NDP-sugar epimerase [Limimaricola soesokkakensis]SLN59215.1 UDP-N-acetyl-alpha-D-glucosamine C6 dehydratase [Limimaricola soesokkakensis]